MADITVCEDDKCPDKRHCKRYTVKRGYMQSHFIDSPRENGVCEFFLSNKIIKKDVRDKE